MRLAILAACFLAGLPAAAQPAQPAGDYRMCAPEAATRGREVVAEACGRLAVPDFSGVAFQSADELGAGRAVRDAFLGEVRAYAACVSDFILARQQPGQPADSHDPDLAACAHAWAEDQATQVVRGFGRACIDYANRSVVDTRLAPHDGPCYPDMEAGEG